MSELLATLASYVAPPIVRRFAGDALLALWADDAPATLVRRAAHCALVAQERLAAFPAGPGHTLTLRIGVSVGALLGPRHCPALRSGWRANKAAAARALP